MKRRYKQLLDKYYNEENFYSFETLKINSKEE